ncbi:hypothetical protein BJV78DRAFT_211635 [Lactifluus subvellereus]|nr:hypothetical protein BJV78DRAFT_211635 [Lactifluus subvellereus]
MQLVELIRALEVLMDSLAILAVVKASRLIRKADPDDDVIFQRPRMAPAERKPAHAAICSGCAGGSRRQYAPLAAGDVARGARGGAARPALPLAREPDGQALKVKLGNVVKLMLLLHRAELMKSPVEDFVVHWQAAVVPSSHGIDKPILEGSDTDSCWDDDRYLNGVLCPNMA